jgi:hypothetical protein
LPCTICDMNPPTNESPAPLVSIIKSFSMAGMGISLATTSWPSWWIETRMGSLPWVIIETRGLLVLTFFHLAIATPTSYRDSWAILLVSAKHLASSSLQNT